MSKAVLISIQPEWCQLIVDGKKTVEVRKTRPKLETPFKCYIYCTYGMGLINRFDEVYPNMLLDQKVTKKNSYGNCCNGKVIGEFVCDRIFEISVTEEGYDFDVPKITGLKYEEMESYLNRKTGYGWNISELVIYENPKELIEFRKPCNNDLYCEICAMFGEFEDLCGNYSLVIKRQPQSWCYAEEL